MTFPDIKEVILRCKNKVNLKAYSIDFAKGYCYGVINTSNRINEDEYNELSRMIDDAFDSKEECDMPENEAIFRLKSMEYDAIERNGYIRMDGRHKELAMAIQALKTIQSIKKVFPELTDKDLEMTANCLEELLQYRAIGTVEECRVAVERMKPKGGHVVEKLTCKYDEQNVLRAMCTFDKESTEEPDDCISCDEICAENDGYDCENCPIQKAFDKLAAYEALGVSPEQIKEMDRLYTEKCKEVAKLQEHISKEQGDLIKRSELVDRFKQLKGSDMLANMFISDVIKEINKLPAAKNICDCGLCS